MYLLFAYSSLFSLAFIDNSRGPLYPEILKSFSISNSTGALIFTLSALSSFIMTIFSKNWLRCFGLIGSSKFALFFHFLACIGMGLTPFGTMGFVVFLVASIFLGLGVGVLSVTMNLIINSTTPRHLKRRAFSGLHSMYCIASLMAPQLMGILALSWQDYFLFLSLMPLSFLIVFSSLKIKNIQTVKKDSHDFKKRKSVIAFVLASYVAGEVLVSSRMVLYLNEVKSIGTIEGGSYLSYFFLSLLAGRLLFTFKKIDLPAKALLYISLLTSLLLLLGGMLLYAPLLALSGLSMSYFFPCAMDWLGEMFQEHLDDLLGYVMMFIGGTLVVVHFLFGIISTYIGVEYAFYLAPALHIFSGISLYNASKEVSRFEELRVS